MYHNVLIAIVFTIAIMSAVENSIVQPRSRPPDNIPTVAADGRDSCNLADEMERWDPVLIKCYTPLPNEPGMLDLACFAVYDVLIEACERSKNSRVDLTGVGRLEFSTEDFCIWARNTQPVRSLKDGGTPAKSVWREKVEQALNSAGLCPQLCEQIILCQLISAGYGILHESLSAHHVGLNHSTPVNKVGTSQIQNQSGVTVALPQDHSLTTTFPQNHSRTTILPQGHSHWTTLPQDRIRMGTSPHPSIHHMYTEVMYTGDHEHRESYWVLIGIFFFFLLMLCNLGVHKDFDHFFGVCCVEGIQDTKKPGNSIAETDHHNHNIGWRNRSWWGVHVSLMLIMSSR